jgi:hypothetical protein
MHCKLQSNANQGSRDKPNGMERSFALTRLYSKLLQTKMFPLLRACAFNRL